MSSDCLQVLCAWDSQNWWPASSLPLLAIGCKSSLHQPNIPRLTAALPKKKQNTKGYYLRHQLNSRKVVAYPRVVSVATEEVEQTSLYPSGSSGWSNNQMRHKTRLARENNLIWYIHMHGNPTHMRKSERNPHTHHAEVQRQKGRWKCVRHPELGMRSCRSCTLGASKGHCRMPRAVFSK